MKIKLITDSTSDLSQELVKRYDIEVIPLMVSFNDDDYLDGIDITTKEMYQKVEELGILPKSSAVSPMRFTEVFTKYLEQGYHVIYIGIGSTFSATFQNATIAKNEINSDNLYLIDSNNLSSGIGMLVLKAASFIEQGDDTLTVVEKVTNLIPKVRSQLVINTLEYLHKGGRLSGLGAFMGRMLKLHPVIRVEDGEMKVTKMVIGSMRKAVNYMIDVVIKDRQNIDFDHLIIAQSESDSFDHVYQKVLENFRKENVYETNSGCVISTHCGKGAIGIVYILK